MNHKAAELLREAIATVPEEYLESVWACFYRPVLIVLTPMALAKAAKAAANKASGQESLWGDEEVDEDKHLPVVEACWSIIRAHESGVLAKLIQEHKDLDPKRHKICKVEPPDLWECSLCRKAYPKGIDGKPCRCGSRAFTGTPPQPLAPYQIQV